MTTKSKNVESKLIHFLNHAPTAWHAVEYSIKELHSQGFQEFKEEEAWHIKPNGKYYVVRNGSSICAFVMPKKIPAKLHVAAAHTDSPAFKLKPNAEFTKENMVMLGLEIYGGPLIASWLNRDLGIAGRIIYADKKGHQHEKLVNITDCPLVIPQLAIHLDRNVNESGPVLNKQEQLAAIVTLSDKKVLKEKKTANTPLLTRLLKKHFPIHELLSTELFVYPLEMARHVGEDHTMIAGYRIDNLISMHAALHGLFEASKASNDMIKMVVFWDNEEIGSHTAQGAGSPFVPHIIERIALSMGMSREEYFRLISRSLCASIDVVHALHPNYADKHEPRHPVLLNHGIVIKNSAQFRYASDARSSAAIIALCIEHKIPYQRYVARGDMSCGSTVGPIHANLTGMPTVDIGCTQLSMHSARELAGTEDIHSMTRLVKAFLS